MTGSSEVFAWLRQAKADLRAGRSTVRDSAHCHHRYWLQQACEKGLKAMGLLLWDATKNGVPATKAFQSNFLFNHSPLLKLQSHVTNPGASSSLLLFQRQLQAELMAFDPKGVLAKIDGTTPKTDPAAVSYRYPFLVAAAHQSPCDWKPSSWRSYQGHRRSVVAAIQKLLNAVENRAKLPGP